MIFNIKRTIISLILTVLLFFDASSSRSPLNKGKIKRQKKVSKILFDQLPIDVIQLLLVSLIKQPDNCNCEIIQNIKSLKNLSTTSKAYKQIINDPKITKILVTILKTNFKCGPLKAASLLNTLGAKDFLETQIKEKKIHKQLIAPCLHNAIRHNQMSSIKFLLKVGAKTHNQPIIDTDFKDTNGGNTALTLAILRNNQKVAQLLIRHNYNVNAINNNNRTPLYIAVQKNSISVCKALLENGANINYLNEIGAKTDSSLILAIHLGHTDIVELLLKYNPNLDYTYNNGNEKVTVNALSEAVKFKQPEIHNMLLEFNKEPRIE